MHPAGDSRGAVAGPRGDYSFDVVHGPLCELSSFWLLFIDVWSHVDLHVVDLHIDVMEEGAFEASVRCCSRVDRVGHLLSRVEDLRANAVEDWSAIPTWHEVASLRVSALVYFGTVGDFGLQIHTVIIVEPVFGEVGLITELVEAVNRP